MPIASLQNSPIHSDSPKNQGHHEPPAVVDMNFLRRLFSSSTESAPDRLPRVPRERLLSGESLAAVYLRADAIILHAYCPTNIGSLACLPCRRLPLPVTDEILGTSLLAILDESLTVPVPADHKAELKRILQQAKISSWRKLIVESASCSIRRTPSSLTITPSQRQGAANHHLPELDVDLALPTVPAEIAQALRTAFQRCN